MAQNRHAGLVPRFAAEAVRAALKDTPVVMVAGPRQCGKTTLVRDMIGERRNFVTLDDDSALAAARGDPTGLVRDFERLTIDEVQRAPDLMRAIKRAVDEKRRAGRFLLTGSANILTLPRVSESLAGRMEVVTLLPLSQAEIRRRRSRFLEAALAGQIQEPTAAVTGKDLVDAVLTGGYPEMIRRAQPHRRQRWALDYLRAILQRDVRDVAEVEALDRMPRLLRLLAHHSGGLVNLSQAGGSVGLDGKTVARYIGILEQLYLVRRLDPWFRNRLKRLVKTPKLHFLDSGLLSALLRLNAARIAADRTAFGPLLETFVFAEVLKQISLGDGGCDVYHYRDKDQDEVDLVIESARGTLVGLEVKAAATVHAEDFRGLRKIAAAGGDHFKLGVVLYDGTQKIPFGGRLYAAPISCLWG